MKKILLFLLIPFLIAAAPSRQNTYVSGTTIRSSDVTQNEDAIFNYLQAGVDVIADGTIVNADINTSANINDTKLATIDDAGKVQGSALDVLTGIPSSAGTIPSVNVSSDFSNRTMVAGTFDGSILDVDIIYFDTANEGDILYDNGSSITRLTPGTASYFLKTQGAGAPPVWGDAGLTSSAGTILNAFADTESEIVGASGYTKTKEISVPKSGTLTIKFDFKITGSATAASRIYRNGVAVGTVRVISSPAAYVTYSEDISGWSPGDLCQLYQQSDGSTSNFIRNFRIYESIGRDYVVTQDD